MSRFTKLLCASMLTGALTAGLFSALSLMQQKAPKLRATEAVATGRADRLLLQSLAKKERLGIQWSRGKLTLDTQGGAEVLELFRVIKAEGFALLLHESPVVRAYAAFYHLREHPAKVSLLTPLLSDPASLEVAMYDDEPKSKTLSELVVDLLCARVEELAVRRYMEKVAGDLTLLGVRAGLKDCLKSFRDDDLPVRLLGASQ